MNPLATNAIAQDTSPRVFRFAEASGVPARPRLALHALTNEAVRSKLHNQMRSWPARATHPLIYAS
jgi:hypothetical protein